jgi:preprotein translocase subunit SecE
MADELSIQKSWWTRVKEYASEVRTEMRRVTWPGRQEVYSTTVLVILTTFFFAFVFWVYDHIFFLMVGKVLDWGQTLLH